MANVIVAFPRPEDARSIKNILVKNGFHVVAVCTSGAQAIASAEDLGSGVVVCGYRLPDMLFAELYDCLSQEFLMLMVAAPGKCTTELPEGVTFLPMPLKVHALVEAVEQLVEVQLRRRRRKRLQPKQRSEEEMRLISQAKQLLIEHNGLAEEEAHRYIQKCSMDNGTNIIETAQMVIRLIEMGTP